ncbi:MAG: polysulfide reductase NrfD [Rhodospirillaceae bacterium]|jgi:formate-dependent nitrite reductase membrane component NrfD|nr:polysulfide reductase NrfD [Rhodospirillaceae bacterium]MBT5562839.1 polysulfide reductase NrfD [Rhodospirillaceae bacterium]MBT6243242.1 polysulfide reductase NrfD [Rhodospirillaceae bacterium]
MHELTWGLPVIAYFFLAGMGAGAVTVSGSVLLRKGGFGASRFAVARCGALIGPIPVMLGTFLIVFELGQPFRAGNLFHLINLSPMSIGSWFLNIFIMLSVLYAMTFMLPGSGPGDRFSPIRRGLAWVLVPLGIGVAVYTGIMLGAMPARPLWNSPILAALFTLSALSSGVASIILAGVVFRRKSKDPAIRSDYENSSYLLITSDALLLGGELLVVFLFLLFGHLTIGDIKYAMLAILPGGQMAMLFWGLVVGVGLLIPLIIELFQVMPKLLHNREFKSMVTLEIAVPLAILIGGFALRYTIVVAGQITAPTTL